jgi:Mg-chelatase subunit ChlD/uncharacterized membrane protein
MVLRDPIWLLLAIPFFVLLRQAKMPSRLMQRLRILATGALILALCGPAILFPSRSGTVVIVADRSASMPAEADKLHAEIIDLVQKEMDASDSLAIVSFGQTPVVDKMNHRGSFEGFAGTSNPDGSNLAESLRSALSLIPRRSPGRILVLTDGQWTGEDPLAVVSSAVGRGISIDYRLMERAGAMDLAIAEVQTPVTVGPQEAFVMTAWVQSPVSQEVSYELKRNGQTIARGRRNVPAGLSSLAFRDKAGEAGTLQYSLSVHAEGQDPVIENNTARMLVGVEGEKPLLCLSATGDSGLADLLARSGMKVATLTPAEADFTLEGLSGYEGMIIEDVEAGRIGTPGMENIAQWVTKAGAGLMMTGGKNSYGPGGYFKSPLEAIMPVSMELRREHRKLSLAIAVALDRSGSMGAPVGFGKTKMDLANLATVEVLDMLSAMDQFGVLAVDSSAHLIVPMSDVSKSASYRSKILQIQSMGGGIFVYEALSHAARMVANAEPQTKHIILFADAADAEEPGRYRELLAECINAGITVSVIGLGKPTDQDALLLEEIASLGQGRCFFTETPEELPRLFAQDTFVVARSSFLEEATTVKSLPSMLTIAGRAFEFAETVGGYNLCYLRDGAAPCAVSVDEYEAPILAAWQSGIGRALCYTAQADGPFTGDFVKWDEAGAFLASMAEWTAGRRDDLADDMAMTQQVVNGNCRIQLHLNPQRKDQRVLKLPRVTVLYGYPSQTPESRTLEMAYLDADTLGVEFAMQGAQTYLSTVEIPGYQPVTLAPVTLAYSPEFKPADRRRAAEDMAAIAGPTGGRERIDVGGIWDDLPVKRQLVSLVPPLAVLAVIAFLLEIFERRTGLLSSVKWDIRLPRRVQAAAAERKRRFRPEKGRKIKPGAADKKLKEVQVKAPDKTEEHAGDNELLDAISRAQQKAQTRTKR